MRKRCPTCGKYLKLYPFRGSGSLAETGDDLPPTRGGMGDNIFDSQACGHLMALRLIKAIPGILDLLPDKWRGDKNPPPKQKKAIKKHQPGQPTALVVPHWVTRYINSDNANYSTISLECNNTGCDGKCLADGTGVIVSSHIFASEVE